MRYDPAGRLIQWRTSELRDPPLNARPHSFVPVAATAALPDRSRPRRSRARRRRRRRSRCCRATAGARCRSRSVADQEFVALDDLAAAFQLTVREESLGAVTVSYKGKTIVLTPGPGAGVGRRAAGLAAGAAVAQRTPLAGAGGVHQPRAVARSTTRGSICASRRTCWSSATCACRASPSATIRSAPPDG